MTRQQRHKRIRAKVKGTSARPRLCVFRSNQHTYAQLIDDTQGKVLASASDLHIRPRKPKTELAFEVGKLIAEKAQQKGIKEVVFDRAGYRYLGRVKALAEGARQAGLKF